MKSMLAARIGALLAVMALAGRSEAGIPVTDALERIAHADSARAFMLTAPRGSEERPGRYRLSLVIRVEASGARGNGRGFTSKDTGVVDLLRRAFPPKQGPSSDSASSAAEPPEFCAVIYEERMPEAMQRVAPEYPSNLSKAGVGGTVQVKALVGRDGTVKDVAIHQSIAALNEYAARAVRQWIFRPATCNGEPIAVWVLVPVKFKP